MTGIARIAPIALALVACRATGLVVTVDTDMTGDGAPSSARLVVASATDHELSSHGPLAPGHPLVVELVPAEGAPSGPLDLLVVGLDDSGNEVIRRSAHASFVDGATRELRLPLVASCAATFCRAGRESCTEGSPCCAPLEPPATTSPWTGRPTLLAGAGADCGDGHAVAELALGDDFACARTLGGAVACWGNPDNEHLGRGAAPTEHGPLTVSFPSPFAATAIGAGRESVCVVASSGVVWCWGNNGLFQVQPDARDLGPRGPVAVRPTTGARLLSVGAVHACATTDDPTGAHAVTCWGAATASAVGPVLGPSGAASTHSGALPIADAVQLAGGCGTECALHHDGSVECWGLAALVSGCALGMGTADPQPVPGLDDAVEIALAGAFGCARRADGSVACWGGNAHGVLGPHATSGGSSATPQPIDGVDGAVLCWGANDHAQLGGPGADAMDHPAPVTVALPAGRTARAIGAGGAFACALRDDGAVQCWGANNVGQADPAAASSGADVLASANRTIALH